MGQLPRRSVAGIGAALGGPWRIRARSFAIQGLRMNEEKELAGRVDLVTGAGRNIGRTIALTLAGAGASVVVNARSSRDEAEKVVDEIRAAGGKASLAMADVTDEAAVGAMVRGALDAHGRLD